MSEMAGFSRRSFLQMVTGSAVGFSAFHALGAQSADAAEGEGQPAAPQPKPRPPAPPYALAGNRLVFLNWSYIQVGSFGWFDGEGKQYGTDGSAEPGALLMRRFEEPWGIRLVAQPAQHVGPVFQSERPWENMGVYPVTTFHDQGVYRAWSVCNSELMRNFFCYLESDDGYTWRRPELGLFDFDGSTQNNLMLQQGWNRTIFIDPTAPPEEKYKMVHGDRPEGISGFVSADGLRWTALPDPVLRDACDTQNTCYYDDSLGKYVIYNRKFVHGRRAIGRAESADFRQFPAPAELLIETGPNLLPSDDLYTNCKTTIPGAPDHHLMFPAVYHLNEDMGSTAMLSSFDGKVWHWVSTEVICESPFGQWDCGYLITSPNLIELPNGDWALPYCGTNTPHKYPRQQLKYASGYALWPKGRMVALQAEDRGEFTTWPIIPPGNKLRINAVTERGGSILVEVTPAQGRSFAEAKPIVGDQFRTPVTWGGQDDMGVAVGDAVALRFRLDNAKLFGLEFE